ERGWAQKAPRGWRPPSTLSGSLAMWSMAILCAALLAQQAGPSPADLATYETEKAKIHRDADAHVRLAEWCGAHGMETQKAKQLGIALLIDPKHERALVLLGRESAEMKERRKEAELAREKLLSDYQAKLKKPPKTADDHWALALWCEAKGMKVEGAVHL